MDGRTVGRFGFFLYLVSVLRVVIRPLLRPSG
jgi:hypothetical protein